MKPSNRCLRQLLHFLHLVWFVSGTNNLESSNDFEVTDRSRVVEFAQAISDWHGINVWKSWVFFWCQANNIQMGIRVGDEFELLVLVEAVDTVGNIDVDIELNTSLNPVKFQMLTTPSTSHFEREIIVW